MLTNELYKLWVDNALEDDDLVKELKDIKLNEDEIYDRFYRELEFGTAGLRGVIGAGTNRMNIYTVRRATQGLANYLNGKYKSPSVAISYDSRIKSELFSKEAACVLSANNIKVFIVKELQPTPVLSFAVREFGCNAGIMMTASHNPAKYNGYKCYGPDGCQMTDFAAGSVYKEIQKVDIFNDIKVSDFQAGIDNGTISFINESFYDNYLNNVINQSINKDICKNLNLKVVYTPLNGAGNKLVRKVLLKTGIENVLVVPEQELPDGNFSTCPYPNPEFKEALNLALDLAQKEQADVVLATDPDCDRVGIAINDGSSFRLLTGNETGILLINYILSTRKDLNTLPKDPVAVKTIVSSTLTEKIAEKYGCTMINVLPGFKYIGEQILNLEMKDEANRYVFGFEESYGYLAGSYVRDKDAVVASMLICEMIAYYKRKGKLLSDVINEIYTEFGFYLSNTLNFAFEGAVGMNKMKEIMENFRNNPIKQIANINVIKIEDYLNSTSKDLLNGNTETINLPKSNILLYKLENNASVIIRPSGTEPKIKAYVTSVGENSYCASEQLMKINDSITLMINS